MKNKEILFIKIGSFSQINNNVYKFLCAEFPDYKIHVLDVSQQKLKIYYYLINIYYFIMEYSIDFVLNRKKWKELPVWFFATSYISDKTSTLIKKEIEKKEFVFTFQTQSLYNTKISGIPHFIYTDHTTQTNKLYPNIHPQQYIRSKAFIKNVETGIYKDATLIFTFGSLITWSLINQYQIPKEKVITVFAGSNVKAEESENVEKYCNKNILFVGVEWERKGGPMLIKIFKKVQKRFPHASLTIVGCSPQVTLPNCKILGKIPVEEVSKYYNNASVFCLPTVREPFGIVFIEAMNYRLPILANSIGSLPDMVKNDYNGYLFDGNVDDYVDAICKLFENPTKCKEMGDNGYLLAHSRFSWKIVGKTIKHNIEQSL
jgi:glycosyltransferase involved in cell wall biosynthesis